VRGVGLHDDISIIVDHQKYFIFILQHCVGEINQHSCGGEIMANGCLI
jgi:hypothetical protein